MKILLQYGLWRKIVWGLTASTSAAWRGPWKWSKKIRIYEKESIINHFERSWLLNLGHWKSRLNDIVGIRVLQQLFKVRNWEQFLDDFLSALFIVLEAFFNNMTTAFLHGQEYKVSLQLRDQSGHDRWDLQLYDILNNIVSVANGTK